MTTPFNEAESHFLRSQRALALEVPPSVHQAVTDAYDKLRVAERAHFGQSVVQRWANRLPFMQQSVLLTAVRGPDGLPKYHPSKYLLRWYRRCLLLSAMDGRVLTDPAELNGGSFTGPSVESAPNPAEAHHYRAWGMLRDGSHHLPAGVGDWRDTWMEAMDDWVTAYIRALDEVSHHFQLHFIHAVEIMGYKHDDDLIRAWWHGVYLRLVKDMHLRPEPEADLDERLSDNRDNWLKHGDTATVD